MSVCPACECHGGLPMLVHVDCLNRYCPNFSPRMRKDLPIYRRDGRWWINGDLLGVVLEDLKRVDPNGPQILR